METKTRTHLDVYAIVTERIIKQLELGTVPWKKPWTEAGIPQNLLSRRHYRGINVWLLASLGYDHNYFLTWRQIKELGGGVTKGEQSHLVIFTRWIGRKVKDETGKEQMIKAPFLRYYKVYNIGQCEDLPTDKVPELTSREHIPIDACEAIYHNMPDAPVLREIDPGRAYYNGLDDFINMPPAENFVATECYYGTLYHELIHSTGHPTRLNRKGWFSQNTFLSGQEEKYSMEELIAEMGACYLESITGIVDSQFQQNAGYIDGWLKQLRSDRRFVVIAAALAQQATDFILNIQMEKAQEETVITS